MEAHKDQSQTNPVILLLNLFPRLMHTFMRGFESNSGKKSGLNHTQVRTMIYLERKGPCPMSGICFHINLEKGSMTSVVDSLISLGFVQRRRDENDKRRILVSLTAAGKTIAENCSRDASTFLDRKLSVLDPEEQASFWNAIAALEKTTEKLQEKLREKSEEQKY